jgi:anti-anti-sigma regulatory factor
MRQVVSGDAADCHLTVTIAASGRDVRLATSDGMDNDGSAQRPLDLVVTSSFGSVAIRVRGEVDRATVGVLSTALEGADQAPQLVVDLSATTFIDLGGVRELARCARRRRNHNRDLVIVGPPPSGEFLLQLMPLHGTVQWVPRAKSSCARCNDEG